MNISPSNKPETGDLESLRQVNNKQTIKIR